MSCGISQTSLIRKDMIEITVAEKSGRAMVTK